MSPAIVDGQDLNVLALAEAVSLFVFDPEIREVHLIIEERKVVFCGPGTNLIFGPIRVAVVVVAVAIVGVQPLLIVALEFIVEDDPFDPRAAVVKPLSRVQIGVEDLRVVFQFSRSFQAGVEGLRRASILLTMPLEEVATGLRQDHYRVPMARHADRFKQTLLAKVPKVR